MFHQQRVDKKLPFIRFSLLINPQLIQGDVEMSVMLAKIRKLLVDMTADEAAVDHPNLETAALCHLLDIRHF